MERDTWNERYAQDAPGPGGHGHTPSGPASSPELAGFIAAAGSRIRRSVDVGCGTGGDAVFLAEQGIEAAGIDFSEAAIERARERAAAAGVEVDWHVGDVRALPLPDASVDLVTDRGCLHHVAEADQPRYAAEIARVLRPGGTLLLRDLRHAPGHGHAHSHAHAHDHGHGAHADVLAPKALQRFVDGLPLTVESTVPYDMISPNGPRPATMVVIVRTAGD